MTVNENIEYLAKLHPTWKYCKITDNRGNNLCILKDYADSEVLCSAVTQFLDTWTPQQYTLIFKIDHTAKSQVQHKFDTRTIEPGQPVQPGQINGLHNMSIEDLESRTDAIVAAKMETIAFDLERTRFYEEKKTFESDSGKLGIIVKHLVGSHFPNILNPKPMAQVQGNNQEQTQEKTEEKTSSNGRDVMLDYESIELLKEHIESPLLNKLAVAIRNNPGLVGMLEQQLNQLG